MEQLKFSFTFRECVNAIYNSNLKLLVMWNIYNTQCPMIGRIMPPTTMKDVHDLIPKRRIKVADGIKFANKWL